jgi:hypothetical protein
MVTITIATHCGAQDYCGLLNKPHAVGALPPNVTADQILRKLSDIASFNSDTFHLHADSDDGDLVAQGTAAQTCFKNQRYIFYNPAFVDQIRTKAGNDWAKLFVFAHEVAHHFNNDPLDPKTDPAPNKNQELLADRSAAKWLAQDGATALDLVDAINAFVVNENRVRNYPSRCERVEGVVEAYNKEAERENRVLGTSRSLYDLAPCMALEKGGGMYARRDLEPKTPLRASEVLQFGSPPSGANRPLNYDHDLDGMCMARALQGGQLLTWDNIGVCALMLGH